eukprot:scaffold321201_cov18-Tisochrysis_lutea.AAC.1
MLLHLKLAKILCGLWDLAGCPWTAQALAKYLLHTYSSSAPSLHAANTRPLLFSKEQTHALAASPSTKNAQTYTHRLPVGCQATHRTHAQWTQPAACGGLR